VGKATVRDLAGTVVGVGEGVLDVELGEAVLGWSQDWAAHARFVAVPAEQLIAKLAGLSWDVAGLCHQRVTTFCHATREPVDGEPGVLGRQRLGCKDDLALGVAGREVPQRLGGFFKG